MLELECAGTGRVLIIGHRGAMAHAPENTMASFELAAELGADLVECDVHLSRDGELVVIHDRRTERTTGTAGDVQAMDLEQIKKLDAGAHFASGFRGEKVPTLDELLGWSRRNLPLVIEVKADPRPRPGTEERLVRLIRRRRMTDRVMVISFYPPCLAEVRRLDPDVPTGLLFARRTARALAASLREGGDAVSGRSVRPHHSLLSRELVEKARRAGLACSTWTVNTPRAMRRAVALGVDSITTNYPERLRSLVDACGAGR